MRITKARIAGAATVVAVAGAGALGAAPSSAQKDYDVPKNITIKAVQKGKKLKFAGPSKVEKGAKIKVLATTNPRKVGPHTFSLVKPSALPEGKAELKDCGKNLGGVCGKIAKAHKVNLKNGKVGKPSVDVGKKGWDKSFGKKGDSYVAETKGATQTRVVKAKAGSKLTFFCAVHPEMQKTVKVTG
jgi:hypothetical protein